jgi:hypothetical protein
MSSGSGPQTTPILESVLSYVNEKGFAKAGEIANSLKMQRDLATNMLGYLTQSGKIMGIETGLDATAEPIVVYCSNQFRAQIREKVFRLLETEIAIPEPKLIDKLASDPRPEVRTLLVILLNEIEKDGAIRGIPLVSTQGKSRAYFRSSDQPLIANLVDNVLESLDIMKAAPQSSISRYVGARQKERTSPAILRIVIRHLLYKKKVSCVDSNFWYKGYVTNRKLYFITGSIEPSTPHDVERVFRRSRIRYLWSRKLAELNLSTLESIEKAMLMLQKCEEKGIVQGRSYELVALSCLYLASRETGHPISLNDLHNEASLKWNQSHGLEDKLILQTTIRAVITGLELPPLLDLAGTLIEDITQVITNLEQVLKTEDAELHDLKQFSPDGKSWIRQDSQGQPHLVLAQAHKNWITASKFSSAQESLKTESLKAAETVPKQLMFGKNPLSVASALIYLSAKKLKIPLTQKEIANAAGITEVTVRNTLRAFEHDYRGTDEQQIMDRSLPVTSSQNDVPVCQGCGLSEADGEKLHWVREKSSWFCDDCATYESDEH